MANTKIFFIEALENTYLKKSTAQASELSDNDKTFVLKGKKWGVASWGDDVTLPTIEKGGISSEETEDGHELIELAEGAGIRYIFAAHWKCPWHKTSSNTPQTQFVLPEWDNINWKGSWSTPISKYFTLGEVCNMSSERIPTEYQIKKNIVAIARHMDAIREWWGGPIAVNSWNRPWAVNRRIGSNAPNHPSGSAVDFRPLNGSVFEMQARFKKEWYDTGKWQGGFGLGANKGFIHIDLRGRRMWNY